MVCEAARVALRTFLLSPASCAGKRCQLLLRPASAFPLAQQMRSAGAPLGEVFSFLSALYFRGKLTYATRFASRLDGSPGVFVITPDRGLIPPDTVISESDLRAFARVPIEPGDRRYTEPLEYSALQLRERLPATAQVVLLGSIATPKYVETLQAAFGRSLLFPGEFVGRGDMSRGGLLLRAARAGVELAYQPVDGAVRRGRRAPRLPRVATR